jgi:glutathione synthase/RimK-type ligase-like ATP-grasp enzyme
MSILIVVDEPRQWPLQIAGVTVVSARAYLTDPAYDESHSGKVFNLCKSYRYQSLGYYVSLLGEARGHKPLPRVSTIEDLQSRNLVRLLTEGLEDQFQRALAPIKSDEFELSIYFGRNVASRYDLLCQHLFHLVPAPLLRASFRRRRGEWRVQGIRPIAASDIPDPHRSFVIESATNYFEGRYRRARRRAEPRFDLAILHDENNAEPPSNARALAKFERAAEAVGLACELITREDIARLAEFDALFIRDTTFVNHYTYRFARRAAAEGLVVIDDPESILRCSNKVYLAELFDRYDVPVPKTLLVHRDNTDKIVPTLALPCVLKKPDGAFSLGVKKVETPEALEREVQALLEDSELIVAQEWLPTEFDWRVGIIDRRVLYVCKYYMARGHWQIVRRGAEGKPIEGRSETLSVGEAPAELLKVALKAANLIGDGFYGVDLKQIGERFFVVEVNDNPSVDAGVEDLVLKDALYREVMGTIVRRIEERKRTR